MSRKMKLLFFYFTMVGILLHLSQGITMTLQWTAMSATGHLQLVKLFKLMSLMNLFDVVQIVLKKEKISPPGRDR